MASQIKNNFGFRKPDLNYLLVSHYNISTFRLSCAVFKLLAIVYKQEMTSSWFLRKVAPETNFEYWFESQTTVSY